MTRINANISIKQLTDQHLLAEHREIKRLPYRYSKRLEKGSEYIPQNHSFTLGKNHELFFVDKGLFTKKRYLELYQECLYRGFNVTNFSDNWDVYRDEHMNDYCFNDAENQLIKDRIAERLAESKQIPKYYGKTISKEEAINLLR